MDKFINMFHRVSSIGSLALGGMLAVDGALQANLHAPTAALIVLAINALASALGLGGDAAKKISE